MNDGPEEWLPNIGLRHGHGDRASVWHRSSVVCENIPAACQVNAQDHKLRHKVQARRRRQGGKACSLAIRSSQLDTSVDGAPLERVIAALRLVLPNTDGAQPGGLNAILGDECLPHAFGTLLGEL